MRRLAPLLALTFLLAGLGALPAYADGAPPVPLPTGVTVPASPGTMPTGPTYVVTPGVGGSQLPPPTDPKVAAQQVAAASRTKAPRRRHAHPPARPTGTAANPALARTTSASSTSREDLAWEIGAGVLLVLVLSEVLRVGFRRRTARRTT